MRNIIKKGLILLSLNLILPTQVLSQTILDDSQTKTLSIILAEHQKFTEENPLLKQQITNLKELNYLYVQSDSIHKIEIKDLTKRVESDKKTIQKYKSNQKKTLIGASAGGILLFIIGLIL